MKAFAELYAALDRTTKTNEKIRALYRAPLSRWLEETPTAVETPREEAAK